MPSRIHILLDLSLKWRCGFLSRIYVYEILSQNLACFKPRLACHGKEKVRKTMAVGAAIAAPSLDNLIGTVDGVPLMLQPQKLSIFFYDYVKFKCLECHEKYFQRIVLLSQVLSNYMEEEDSGSQCHC